MNQDTSESKLTFRLIAGVILAVLLALFLWWLFTDDDVTSYRECVDAGYAVSEGPPRTCIAPDGTEFVDPTADGDQETTAPSDDEVTTDPAPSDRNEQAEATVIGVYFSSDPESFNDFAYTERVERTTERVDVGTFAIEELIDGPRQDEPNRLFSPLAGIFSGGSNCNGNDFSLAVADGRATLQFCRAFTTAGVGEDARIQTTASDSLLQFSTVDEVQILRRDGSCFANVNIDEPCQ